MNGCISTSSGSGRQFAASKPGNTRRDDLEAERVGVRIRFTRARPWPERPVSAANMSGKHPAPTRPARTYPRTF